MFTKQFLSDLCARSIAETVPTLCLLQLKVLTDCQQFFVASGFPPTCLLLGELAITEVENLFSGLMYCTRPRVNAPGLVGQFSGIEIYSDKEFPYSNKPIHRSLPDDYAAFVHIASSGQWMLHQSFRFKFA